MLGGNALLVESIQAVDFVLFASNFERGATIEAVHRIKCLPQPKW
jgi:hypothetical protein